MITADDGPSLFRRALAMALCVLVGVTGVLLALASDLPGQVTDVPLPIALLGLITAYVLAMRYTLDYEVRGNAQSVALVQLPLALGVQAVAPILHVVARAGGALVYVLLKRQAPLKGVYNLSISCFEVGVATWIVSQFAPTGPEHWVALYTGLMLGDLMGAVLLGLVWQLIGVPAPVNQTLSAVLRLAPVTLVFTAAAIIAVNSIRHEPWTAAIIVGLVGGLGLAYRAHRRVVTQQHATERLYGFVSELGPLHLDDDATVTVLERMRLLLHAESLDLAVRQDEQWCHVVVTEGAEARRSKDGVVTLSSQVATTGTAMLRRGAGGDADSMATPLVGSAGLTGILTANDRMGATREFDMQDLRLLETVGAQLSTALERGQLLADLERAATTDSLTGLPNLAETTRLVDALLASQPTGIILAAAAVDSFREVNDTLGHEVGDELLVEVTRRLRLSAPGAVVGRIGGGRFAVAVPAGQVGGDAEIFGLGLRAQVEGAAQIGPVGTHVKLSLGVLRGPEHGSAAATLIRRAETAMYSARHATGGPVLWEPAYEVQGTRRLAVVMALREALAGGAIGVAYQPKIHTSSGAVTGVEALARWTHPALGAIGPDEFVPLAEASGLMGPLTATVLKQSLTACKGWQRRAAGVGVAVNVSADTVLDPSFVTEVAAVLAAVGISAELLTLELTEGVVVHDAELAVVRMQELRTLGLKISVDDFGTGYSSLTYLKGLPVDEVKIDKGFVDALASDPSDRAVVRGVVDIAHTLGLRVVAEGVENEDQHGILRALGVDEVQGFLHARPMPANDVRTWLRRREAALQL